ncbi:hypothetical protein ERO13_A05G416301v2 [Gossypium hirsutum]|nr:hypothetical protein ERO13_A05G416301v2 [Gossypium hirsutum]
MFRPHCFVLCFKSIDLDLFVLFVCFLCTFSSGIQKRISSSPNAIKLIVFSFIRISLAYTELKRIYEGFLFSYSKSHCYVPLKLWISVWASVLAFGPVPSLVYGLLGFYPAWRLSDPICKCTKTKVSLLWTSAIHINPRMLLMDSLTKISFSRCCIRGGDLIIVYERHDTMKVVKSVREFGSSKSFGCI